ATPQRTLKSLTSTPSIDSGNAHQLFTTGALVVNLKPGARLAPFVTFGAGWIAVRGDLPSASLTGNYQFNGPSGAPFNETDTVLLRDTRTRNSFAGILGGGIKYRVTPRWGLRFDARAFVSGNSGSTTLDAAPNVALGQLPGGRVTLNAEPTIQFGNSAG